METENIHLPKDCHLAQPCFWYIRPYLPSEAGKKEVETAINGQDDSF